MDLLNALGNRDEIYIPFPAMAYEKSNDLDWIKWLTRNDADLHYVDDIPNIDSQQISTYTFSKNT